MGPAAGVASALSLVSTGLSVFGNIAGGAAKQQGADFQAQQAEQAAQYGQIKAAQTQAYMTRDLTASLANIQAVRDSAQTEGNSPTGEAIEANTRTVGNEQIANRVDSINAQVTADQQAAAFYTQSGQNALLGGFLGGAGSLVSGLGGALKSGFGLGPPLT